MPVQFINVLPEYRLSESITAYFTGAPKANDYVGVCRKDKKYCYEVIQITKEFLEKFACKSKYQVVFENMQLWANQLDMNVEYVFIYLSEEGILATSSPFRLVPTRVPTRKLETLPLSKEYFFDAIEKGLLKQNEKLTSSLRLAEDKTENKILTNEEILNENARLTKALESANKELVELKDEVKDLKLLSGHLIKKLSISKRKVDTFEPEKPVVPTPLSAKVYSGLNYGLENLAVPLLSESEYSKKLYKTKVREEDITSYPSSGLYYEQLKQQSEVVRPSKKLEDFLGSLPPNLQLLKGLSLSKPEVGSKIVENSINKDYSKKLYKTTVREEDVASYPSSGLYYEQLKHQSELLRPNKNLEDFLGSLPPNLQLLKGLPLSKPEEGSKIVENSIVKDYSKKLYKTTVREEDVTSYPSSGLY